MATEPEKLIIAAGTNGKVLVDINAMHGFSHLYMYCYTFTKGTNTFNIVSPCSYMTMCNCKNSQFATQTNCPIRFINEKGIDFSDITNEWKLTVRV